MVRIPTFPAARRVSAAALSIGFLAGLLAWPDAAIAGTIAGFTMSKSANPSTFTAANQTITYTYVITNVRDPLDPTPNSILNSLTDNKIGTIDVTTACVGGGDDGHPNWFGKTITCTGTYTTTGADVLAGSVANTATGSGDSCRDGCISTFFASASIALGASWTLSVMPNPGTYSAAAQPISYGFVLTNTGGVDIGSINIVDSKATGITCPMPILTAGSSMTCTGSYTTQPGDLPNNIADSATASGIPTSGTLADATAQGTVTFTAHPAWTLTKTPNPMAYNAANQTINYSYSLTNTGNVAISAIAVTDSRIATVNCPANTLALGASMTCTASYVTKAADLPNDIGNLSTAKGTPAAGLLADATASANVAFMAQPSWTLTKTPNPAAYSAAGQTINYSYLVTNTGNVVINAIAVTDNRIATVNCPANTLALGASMTCTASYLTKAADLPNDIGNLATAKGTPAVGSVTDATASANVVFTAQPSWTLTKTPNPTSYSAAGQTINYSYLLTNTGNVAINAIAVSDNKVAAVNCPANTLATGASMTCTGTYATKAADLPLPISNTATATGTAVKGALATAMATATVAFTAQPAWTLAKTSPSTGFTAAGQAIGYTYTLNNTGNVAIHNIAIADNKIATVNCPATTLASGANMTCTASYTTVGADVTNAKVTNIATATGTPVSGALAAATATATVNLTPLPSWTLTETALPASYTGAGQQITFTFVVTNTGNVPITNITVTDSVGESQEIVASLRKLASVINCPSTTLSPGQSMTCTLVYQTTAADVAGGNIVDNAQANGTPAGAAALAPANAQAQVALVAGTITIRTISLGVDATFAYSGSLTAANAAFASIATTGGNGTVGPVTLNPATYTITESAQNGFSLSGLSCTGDNNGSVDLAGRTATINLDGGETVVCTFVNAGIARPIPALGDRLLLLLAGALLLVGAASMRRRSARR